MMLNRVYCDVCDKLCIQRFYKNNLKLQTHNNNTHKDNHFKQF